MSIICGDCLDVMRGMEPNSVDAIVTDPPYGLKFMGKDWDHGIPGVPFWEAALRVAKPGCHLLAFGGTRTFHRLTCAIEDAGWEIRDCLMWVYGSGFPKSHDVSKAIDKAAGAEREIVGPKMRPDGKAMIDARPNGFDGCHEGYDRPWKHDRDKVELQASITAPATDAVRQWEGWGTALKPAWEPIIMARKPLEGTVAANVQKWGTGAINVDASRIPANGERPTGSGNPVNGADPKAIQPGRNGGNGGNVTPPSGRWPANLIHDGSGEVLELFPETKSGDTRPHKEHHVNASSYRMDRFKTMERNGDSGSAARFFYCAKASRSEREAGMGEAPERPMLWSAGTKNPGSFQSENTHRAARNNHPCVKPLALMIYLCRLITPPAGTILDPFMGSGTTGMAARAEGFRFIGIDKEKEYCDIAERRISGQ